MAEFYAERLAAGPCDHACQAWEPFRPRHGSITAPG